MTPLFGLKEQAEWWCCLWWFENEGFRDGIVGRLRALFNHVELDLSGIHPTRYVREMCWHFCLDKSWWTFLAGVPQGKPHPSTSSFLIPTSQIIPNRVCAMWHLNRERDAWASSPTEQRGGRIQQQEEVSPFFPGLKTAAVLHGELEFAIGFRAREGLTWLLIVAHDTSSWNRDPSS